MIRGLGVEDPGSIAGNTVLAGCLGCGLMGVIYLAVAVAGAQTRAVYPAASNGGEVLLWMAQHYFGAFGAVILAVTVTFACLKPRWASSPAAPKPSRPSSPMAPPTGCGAVGFSLFSCGAANFGLNTILAWAPRC